jgi:SAM-dependent methyltransferase
MDGKPWFTKWFNSPYYHLLYLKRDEAEATRFINKLIDHLQPLPDSVMLDMACGQGRHARYLAKKGFDVTGIDLSPGNILAARKYESDKLHFFIHDMRLPFWINYFNYAFNFFTSFGYFNTRREHENSLRTIAQSLKPGGVFVIDYLNAHYAERHLLQTAEKQIDNVNFHLTKWFDENHFYKKIIVEDHNLKKPLEFEERVTKFSLGDFTDMLSFQKLQIQEVFGDYNFNSYNLNSSPRMLIIAKKTAY